MDLDEFIIAIFCEVDDLVSDLLSRTPEGRLRTRGPQPLLGDSEAIAIEIVGECLGLSQDKKIFQYFRRHYAHFFPGIARICRTTFVRQTANLWSVKRHIWQNLVDRIQRWEDVSIIDSMPLPVCRFPRAPRCKRFRGEAGFGKDHVICQTFYGFRLHAIVQYPGVIREVAIEPANISELAVLPDLANKLRGCLLGDRNYWSPKSFELLKQQELTLIAPYRSAKKDPFPKFSRSISKARYLIDTVFGQLSERFDIKRIWARDAWHLISRLARKLLGHTLMILFAQRDGKEPLQFAKSVI